MRKYKYWNGIKCLVLKQFKNKNIKPENILLNDELFIINPNPKLIKIIKNDNVKFENDIVKFD